MRRIIQVTETDSGQRIDKLLSQQLPELTRSAIQHLMQDGCVTIGEQPVKKNAKAAAGDVIAVEVPEPKEVSIEPENIPLDIVYEDEDIIVVNKPKGMVVHPAPGNWSGTLVNALMYHCGDSLSGINGEIRPGIVHRIDKDTSGLLVVAKKRPRASVAGGTDSSAQRGTPLFCCGLWMPAGGNRHNTSADCPPSGRQKENGGSRRRSGSDYALSGAGALSGLYIDEISSGDRTHASDSRAHGAHWPSDYR